MPALETSESHASLSLTALSKGSSSSHARWQGAARWKQGWNDAWKGWNDSAAAAPPITQSILGERVTMLHTRCKFKYNRRWWSPRGVRTRCTEQVASRTDRKCRLRSHGSSHSGTRTPRRSEAFSTSNKNKILQMSKTVHSEAVKSTLEKTDALEKLVKPVTMRAESLATTEADLFQTLLHRQEETQGNLHELSAQLLQTRSTLQASRRANKTSTCSRSSAHEAEGSVRYSMSEGTEAWLDVRPKGAGKRRLRPDGRARSMSSFLKVRTRGGASATTGQMVRRIRDTRSCVRVDLSEVETFGWRPDAGKRHSPLPSFRMWKRGATPVPPRTQETFVMPKAELFVASADASAGRRCPK